MGGKGVLQLDENAADCAIIVAHPDDETLWAGGTILLNPQCRWSIIALCRKNDPDRAPKFAGAMQRLNACGFIGDLDDSPDQRPLAIREVEETITSLLPPQSFDLIITHSLRGEYTRHLRHEETAAAVLNLWQSRRLSTRSVWMFAYEDGDKKYLPRAIKSADETGELAEEIWQKKFDIITNVYGFPLDSFEATTCPRHEAFWCLRSAEEINNKFTRGK